MIEKDLNPYRITIIGEQVVDGESNRIEVLTDGKFMRKRDHFLIGYREYDEDNPTKIYNNVIRVDEDMVTISRTGPQRSRLLLQKGRRHQCIYSTVAGNLTIGVFTKTLNNSLGDKGGTLEVSYTLDFNTDLVSENRFHITIEEKN
ncbi:MAG: DUF1934 domain-containing protein [Ruminococcus sp.]|nr:DUF1934 domain-containing protein [Ruminococcus sp.]MBR1484060.1 DUF1934 domain-containing protein [Ruminococcus sp.]